MYYMASRYSHKKNFRGRFLDLWARTRKITNQKNGSIWISSDLTILFVIRVWNSYSTCFMTVMPGFNEFYFIWVSSRLSPKKQELPQVFEGIRVSHLFIFLCYVVFLFCFVCLLLVSCLLNVAIVFGLSILNCPFGFLLRLITFMFKFTEIWLIDLIFFYFIYFCKNQWLVIWIPSVLNHIDHEVWE